MSKKFDLNSNFAISKNSNCRQQPSHLLQLCWNYVIEKARVDCQASLIEVADKKKKLTCEDVLNSIGDDEVLVGDESMDGFLVALGNSSLWDVTACHFSDYFT